MLLTLYEIAYKYIGKSHTHTHIYIYMSLSKLQELVMDREAWHDHGVTESEMTEQLY